jgi:pimeloyl-ACP methyl ester carboxylesterase
MFQQLNRLLRMIAVLAAFSPLASTNAYAEEAGTLMRIPSARADAKIPVFVHATEGARATVVLLSGGGGGIGKVSDGGWPDSSNFLVRTAPLFAASGFNVAVMARASDLSDLDYGVRVGKEHMDDIRKVLQKMKEKFPGSVWLVGTSRGTVSAAAAGIALRDEKLIDGIALTSSVTDYKKTGAVPAQDLDRLTVPVLVMHHEQDGCKVCRPHEVSGIMRGLKNAPVKKLVMVNGGSNPSGDPCEGMHYHGYIGMEKETVGIISDWIKKPTS